MKNSKKICNHIHLPLQSGSTEILDRMNRHYTKEHYLALVEKIRGEIPDVAITTDIIVGFPGETEADFQDTLDVVRRARYDSAYTFIYSKRTGTPAAAMENQVPEDVVKDRFDRLLAVIGEVTSANNDRYVGTVQDVLVESVNDHDGSLVTGRMTNNTLVHFAGAADLVGRIVQVRLTEGKGFYYFGERV
jgi:tRNA-2-methylthio-N6-dimethylallyladenosine synthase